MESTLFTLPDGKQLSKTLSLGLSEYPQDGDTLYKILKFADVALYAAKNQGRTRVVRFVPEMWQETSY